MNLRVGGSFRVERLSRGSRIMRRSRNNLYRFVSFYKCYSDIFRYVLDDTEIVPTLMGLFSDIDIFVHLLNYEYT